MTGPTFNLVPAAEMLDFTVRCKECGEILAGAITRDGFGIDFICLPWGQKTKLMGIDRLRQHKCRAEAQAAAEDVAWRKP